MSNTGTLRGKNVLMNACNITWPFTALVHIGNTRGSSMTFLSFVNLKNLVCVWCYGLVSYGSPNYSNSGAKWSPFSDHAGHTSKPTMQQDPCAWQTRASSTNAYKSAVSYYSKEERPHKHMPLWRNVVSGPMLSLFALCWSIPSLSTTYDPFNLFVFQMALAYMRRQAQTHICLVLLHMTLLSYAAILNISRQGCASSSMH